MLMESSARRALIQVVRPRNRVYSTAYMSQSGHHFPLIGCAWALGAILLLVVVLTAWTTTGLFEIPLCENTIKQEVTSPDGRLKIVVFSRECGATTGFNSQATIINASDRLPDAAGTVFITDKDDVTVSWPDPNRVLVSMKGTGPNFKQEKLMMGVSIVYQ
jgi:hypothetical protein